MRKFFLFILSCLLFIFLNSTLVDYTKTIPLKHCENDAGDGIDIYESITDPLEWYQAYAEFAVGLASCNLYSNLELHVIYDTDSVIQGESLRVKIIAKPVKGSKPVIYSNFGACAGVGIKTRLFGLLGGTWATGPSLGIDFNINIESSDNPPFYPGEKAKGDDYIDFLSLIPDIKGASSSGGKVATIVDSDGDTLSVFPKDDGSSGASDVLGLFDILSLKLSGGFKIENGIVRMLTEGDGSVIKSPMCFREINNRNDTLILKVYVDSFALQNSQGYLYLRNPYYNVDLYRRIGLALSSFGITIASTYWLDNNFYEYLGLRSLVWDIPVSEYDKYIQIPIKVVGEPLFRPDLKIDKILVFSVDNWGHPTLFTQAGISTQIGISYSNIDDHNVADTTIIRIIIDNKDTLEVPTDFLYPTGYGWAFVNYTFQTPGDHYITAEINPDRNVEEIVYTNNTYSFVETVVPPTKLLTVMLLDSLNNPFMDVKSLTISSNDGVKEFYTSLNCFTAHCPGNDTVLCSAIPDSTSNYAPTSFYIVTNNIPITGFVDTVSMNVYSTLEGQVFNIKGDPIPNAKVSLGSYNVITDSIGYFKFKRVMPLSDTTFKYLIKISHPAFQPFYTYLHVGSNQHLVKEFFLNSYDTTPPSGIRTYVDNYYYNNGKYICSWLKPPKVKFMATDNYSGFYSVLIKTNLIPWSEFNIKKVGIDSFIVIDLPLDKPATNGWTYYWYSFKDLAGNQSTPVKDSLIMVVNGPNGNIVNPDTIVFSPKVSMNLVATDSFFPVRYIETGVVGYIDYTKYNLPYTTDRISVDIPSEPGVYTIYVKFFNSENIEGNRVEKTISFVERGSLTINDDDEYTNSTNVIVKSFPKIITSSNTTFEYEYGGMPIAQSFIPHTDQISAIGIFTKNVNSPGIYAAIYSDTLSGSYHLPNRMLGYGFLPPVSDSSWKYISLNPPVNVNPDSLYHIVLYTDLFGSTFNGVCMVSYMNPYPDGQTYYSPTAGNWYPYGGVVTDLAFKIYSAPDSFWISNFDNFSLRNTYFSNYENINWSLTTNQGSKTVYGQFFKNGLGFGKIYDNIIFDNQPPYNCSLSINHGALFTTLPYCTIDLYAYDDLSKSITAEVNGVTVPLMTGLIFPFSDTLEGTKSISVRFKDEMGNWSSTITKYIDYDKDGINFNPLFNNSTSRYVSTRYPTLYLNVSKSIVPDSVRFSENIIDKGIFRPYQPTYQCTLLADRRDHNLFIEVKDNYGFVSKATLFATVDSTKPYGILGPVVDEGTMIPYKNNLNFSWSGIPKDDESGIKGLYVSLKTSDHQTVKVCTLNTFANGITISGVVRYVNYHIHLFAENNAGIFSDVLESDGIVLNSKPTDLILLSPINGEIVSNRPTFTMTSSDADPDTVLKYHIEISSDSSFSNIIKDFDMRVDPSLWSKPAYASGEIASITLNEQNELEIGKAYFWRAFVYDPLSSEYQTGGYFVCGYQGIEQAYNLGKNDTIFKISVVNGFNFGKEVKIKVNIPVFDELKLYIVDNKGSVVRTIFNGKIERGGYIFKWNCKNHSNSLVSKGTYILIAELKSKNRKIKEKILLLK
ncbi:MAG: hypothetical protein ABIN35_03815 [candidate division WOR-3 bacterium]